MIEPEIEVLPPITSGESITIMEENRIIAYVPMGPDDNGEALKMAKLLAASPKLLRNLKQVMSHAVFQMEDEWIEKEALDLIQELWNMDE